MATVSDVTIKYATRGAKAAQKADEGVRSSIKETAKTARQESGTISRWMQRHRAALIGIGAATAAAMGAIISNSPTLSAELSTVRLGFSLLAMQIGEDLAPALEGAGNLALDAADKYRDLPDPIRKTTSAIIGIGGVLGGLAVLLAGLETIISGTFVATLGSKALGAIWGFISGSLAFAAAVGAILGLLGVWVLKVTGVLDMVKGLGEGIRNIIGGPLADFIVTLLTLTGIFPLLAVLGGAIIGFLENGFSGAIEGAKEVIATLWNSVKNTFGNIASFITETVPGLIRDALGYVIEVFRSWAGNIYEMLIGGSMFPEMFEDIGSWIRSEAVGIITSPLSFVGGKIRGVFESLNPVNWGKDLMIKFSNGIESAKDKVKDKVGGVKDIISSAISFDRVANDREARRWGSDLLEEFASGARQRRQQFRRTLSGLAGEVGNAMQATPSGTGGGGGSPTVQINFERDAIRQRADGTVEVDQRNVTQEQGSAFDSRSNI